jgi:CheY-like chemotaxis protein
VRSVGRDLLEYLGFTVCAVENGRAAVETFAGNPTGFCAVLMDMTMPGMSGTETMLELRRIRPDVVVVLCSGYTREAFKPEEKHLRPAAFIEKPYQLDVLRSVFSAVLQPS